MIIQWHGRIVMGNIAIATRPSSFSENSFAIKRYRLSAAQARNAREDNERIKKTREDGFGMTVQKKLRRFSFHERDLATVQVFGKIRVSGSFNLCNSKHSTFRFLYKLKPPITD
jgi:hypothetical protein